MTDKSLRDRLPQGCIYFVSRKDLPVIRRLHICGKGSIGKRPGLCQAVINAVSLRHRLRFAALSGRNTLAYRLLVVLIMADHAIPQGTGLAVADRPIVEADDR